MVVVEVVFVVVLIGSGAADIVIVVCAVGENWRSDSAIATTLVGGLAGGLSSSVMIWLTRVACPNPGWNWLEVSVRRNECERVNGTESMVK